MRMSINTYPNKLMSRSSKFASKFPEETWLKMSVTQKRAPMIKNSTIGTIAVMIKAIEVLRGILICTLLIKHFYRMKTDKQPHDFPTPLVPTGLQMNRSQTHTLKRL